MDNIGNALNASFIRFFIIVHENVSIPISFSNQKNGWENNIMSVSACIKRTRCQTKETCSS
jgi:hypothetical protein